MLSTVAVVILACSAAVMVEKHGHCVKKRKHLSEVVSALRKKGLDQKCTVDEYIRADQYVREYYGHGFLLEFIHHYESTNKEPFNIKAMIDFLEAPKELKTQYSFLTPVV
ncbi:hypothetical protein THF1C08_320117 [Vibrio jasicida]|jgi:hypothetical protein|uniref:Uncharacterized protein n=1 Tax=Vibrio jasicida TaxID=766224 RepID=A0AAU9QST2_9VIBR|nr:hypothetical protein THF1C08_320117 [Vibrio jasicida]CAH1597606.1 hypothetical protein THF1A12_320118 [Vibrio jasicida]